MLLQGVSLGEQDRLQLGLHTDAMISDLAGNARHA